MPTELQIAPEINDNIRKYILSQVELARTGIALDPESREELIALDTERLTLASISMSIVNPLVVLINGQLSELAVIEKPNLATINALQRGGITKTEDGKFQTYEYPPWFINKILEHNSGHTHNLPHVTTAAVVAAINSVIF